VNVRIARYFVAIAEHGSMRDAAEALNVAQPALSRTISNLEQDHGLPLLERHSRGVNLTAAGEIFLRYARDELVQHEQLRSDIEGLKGLQHGFVRITAIESFARSLLPRLIGAFWRIHPEIEFDVNTDVSDHLLAAVLEGETDIGLTYNSLTPPGIEVRMRAREPMVALVAANHPLANQPSITMRDAAPYPAALTVRGSRSRYLVDEACRTERVSLRMVLETNYVELLTQLVEVTPAVTFLLRYSALDRIESGTIRAIPIRNDLMNNSTIEILTRASRQLPPAATEFLKALTAELTPDGADDEPDRDW